METKSATVSKTASNPIASVDSGLHISTSDPAYQQEPEEPRMIGDFDGSSSALWTLYRDEAKSHDDGLWHVESQGRDIRVIQWLIGNLTEDAAGARVKARMKLLRDNTVIRQLTEFHPLGSSAASLVQSFTWLGNALSPHPCNNRFTLTLSSECSPALCHRAYPRGE